MIASYRSHCRVVIFVPSNGNSRIAHEPGCVRFGTFESTAVLLAMCDVLKSKAEASQPVGRCISDEKRSSKKPAVQSLSAINDIRQCIGFATEYSSAYVNIWIVSRQYFSATFCDYSTCPVDVVESSICQNRASETNKKEIGANKDPVGKKTTKLRREYLRVSDQSSGRVSVAKYVAAWHYTRRKNPCVCDAGVSEDSFFQRDANQQHVAHNPVGKISEVEIQVVHGARRPARQWRRRELNAIKPGRGFAGACLFFILGLLAAEIDTVECLIRIVHERFKRVATAGSVWGGHHLPRSGYSLVLERVSRNLIGLKSQEARADGDDDAQPFKAAPEQSPIRPALFAFSFRYPHKRSLRSSVELDPLDRTIGDQCSHSVKFRVAE